MGILDKFKPHKWEVYRPGMAIPEPDYETATGRCLYSKPAVEKMLIAAAKAERERLAAWLDERVRLVDCDCGCNSKKVADQASGAYARAAASFRSMDDA